MERIVIEVNKTTAKKWRESSKPKRRNIAALVAKALQEDAAKAENAASPATQARLEASVNEASLAKEWLSEEDNRWDALLK